MNILGTESLPAYHGTFDIVGPFAPIPRQPKQHAYETLDGDEYYADLCKVCEAPESEHNGVYKIVEYLKAVVIAYRNPHCPFAFAAMVRWGERLDGREKAVAMDVLAVTGVEVW